MRMSLDRLPKQVLYSQLSSGHRKRGHPRLRFKDTFKRNLKLRDNKGPRHPAGQTGHEVANNVKMTGAEISYLLAPGQGAETGMCKEHCWCFTP